MVLAIQIKLINDYSKVAGYKINTQKSIAFLYTNNEKIEKEIKETIPFTIVRYVFKHLLLDINVIISVLGVLENNYECLRVLNVERNRNIIYTYKVSLYSFLN